jgi:hypothetical protein
MGIGIGNHNEIGIGIGIGKKNGIGTSLIFIDILWRQILITPIFA